MRFSIQGTPCFILGIVFNPSYSFWIGFGWVEFQILFHKNKTVLDTLPEFPPIHFPCKNCGANDEGQSCNMDKDMNVTNCEKCSEVRAGEEHKQ